MQKLIKIKEDHYVVVDDSEIKTGDIVAEKLLTGKYELFETHTINDIDKLTQKKITHSTRPLKKEKITNPTTQIVREAMEIASKDVRAPKVVRDGLVKPIVELLSLQEVKELTGEVDVEKDYVLSRLCVYDKRNPDYIPYDEDNELRKPTDCSCDNCFYGRTILSEKILQLNRALEDNKEKKYTEEDLGLFLEYVRDNYTGMGAPHLVHNKGGQRKTKAIVQDYIQSLQSKTEWEVEIVDGKLKLK